MTAKTDIRLGRLFSFGRPFSPLYSFLMASRSVLYLKGIFKQHQLEFPVISVGNLLLGGTGKTPLVYYIAKLLQQQGRKPAILSRGYKGSATGLINVVADGTDILLDAKEAGDEPRLLAEKLAGIPVITGRKRFITGRFAIDTLGADILILDDGFQHMALKRDLNLVLFTAQKLLGNGQVLPGGELREPISSLKRADAFIITGISEPLDSNVKEFMVLLENLYPEKPVFKGSYQSEKLLIKIYNGKKDTISQMNACKIPLYAFCGIARPDSFKITLKTTGIKLTGFQEYEDHHSYSAADIQSLLHKAENSGASGVITTEKDMVKMHQMFPPGFPLIILPVELRLDEEFDRFLINHVANALNP